MSLEFRSIAVLTVALIARSGLCAAPPAGLPYERSDCEVHFTDGTALIRSFDAEVLLDHLFSLLGDSRDAGLLRTTCFSSGSGLKDALSRRGVFLAEYAPAGESADWVAWVDLPDEADRRALLLDLAPVLESDRLVVPSQSISLYFTEVGLLVAPDPPGGMLADALRGIRTAERGQIQAHDPVPGSVAARFRNSEALGGETGISLSMDNDGLRLDLRIRGLVAELAPDSVPRNLDIEILDRLPNDVIMAMVEHVDIDLIPGEGVISSLLPYLIEPEPSDERRARRLVVVSEASRAGLCSVPFPALAVAIEVDGPGASLRRQDLQVLASLNSLRNRLGDKAGLQHLPSPDEFTGDGARTIFTRALLGPAFAGHPVTDCLSVNWGQAAAGSARWQLYATTQELASLLGGCLSVVPGHAECVVASHAGRLDADRALEQVRNWAMFANDFLPDSGVDELFGAVELLSSLLEKAERIDWRVLVPERNALDAVVHLHASARRGGDE